MFRGKYRFLPPVLILFAFAIVGIFMIVSSHAAVIPGEFQVFCSVSHTKADDPIVYPGQAGASHMHSFYGNVTTQASTTTESLMATKSNCGRNMQSTDRSAYWIPSLYQVQSDGSLRLAPTSSQTAFIYYTRAGGSAGPRVLPFPNGLRMIVGSATATSATPQPLSQVRWSCGGGGGGPQTAYIPSCNTAGQPLHGSVDFPNCWDGRNLDSVNHKSHMAFSTSNGTCPSTHPVSLPQLHLDLDFAGITGGPGYVLASGGQHSMHADFFAAWDVQAQNALVTECLNTPRPCTGIERNGGIISKPSYDGDPIPDIILANYPSTPLTTGTLPPAPSPPPPMPPVMPNPVPAVGDVNGDGRINALDLSTLISHDNQNYPVADFNKDNIVGAADLAILLSKWTW